MTTIARERTSVKPARPRRPFGEGIVDVVILLPTDDPEAAPMDADGWPDFRLALGPDPTTLPAGVDARDNAREAGKFELAYNAGFSAAMEAGHDVAPPARYGASERAAFEAGVFEASRVWDARELARLEDLELEASSHDHAEWSEARMSMPRAVAMD